MTQLVLPPVLIGPILRRVDERSVSVFIATSAPASVRLSVYDGIVDAASPPAEHVGADAETTAFGARFHATVITARITGDTVLMPGHRYSYDLRIALAGSQPQSLKDLGLLKDSTLDGYGTLVTDAEIDDAIKAKNAALEGALKAMRPTLAQRNAEVDVCAIGYADGQLPSFVTCPDTLAELVMAHASCRKPHGDGNPALQYVDDLIDDLHSADAGHPHMLFLTGDQIYADDVAAALLPGLNTLGIALLSSDGAGVEQVPSSTDNAVAVAPKDGQPVNVNTMVLPAGFRQRLLGSAGFTSESAACHLIGFGEWLAMYCIAWNPQLWPVLALADTALANLSNELKARFQVDASHSPDNAERVLGRPSPEAPDSVVTALYGAPAENAEALLAAMQGFLGAKAQLDRFRREVPKVRRLLANVPTYMIGDDHEVSDDWFMTGAIRTRTTGNLFGKALLRNAMSAYAVCQAWGNEPVRWAGDADRKALLAGISGMYPSTWQGGLPVPAACDAIDLALGLGPTLEPKFDFSFTVDGPMHRVRVLDTRTRRLYSTAYASPGLLTPQALDTQLPAETLPDGHVLIVVSPAPVFGPAVMNELGGVFAANEYDIASFARSISSQSQEQSVTGLNNGRPLGSQFYDAEHWSAHPAAFERLLERLSHYPRVVVLGGDVHYAAAYAMDWSGAGRNSRIVHFTSSAASNGWFGTVRNLMLLNGMSVGLQRIGMPMTRLGWNNTLPPVVDDVSNEPPLPRIRVQTGPVLLSNELFQHRHPLTRAPEWLWRANPIVDVRAPADRPVAARSVGVDTELPAGADAVHHYGDLAAAHVLGLDSVAIARGLQFLNNAGVIRFAAGADGTHVSQSLLSLRARTEPNEKAAAYILHDTLIEPVPLAVPTTIGPDR